MMENGCKTNIIQKQKIHWFTGPFHKAALAKSHSLQSFSPTQTLLCLTLLKYQNTRTKVDKVSMIVSIVFAVSNQKDGIPSQYFPL